MTPAAGVFVGDSGCRGCCRELRLSGLGRRTSAVGDLVGDSGETPPVGDGVGNSSYRGFGRRLRPSGFGPEASATGDISGAASNAVEAGARRCPASMAQSRRKEVAPSPPVSASFDASIASSCFSLARFRVLFRFALLRCPRVVPSLNSNEVDLLWSNRKDGRSGAAAAMEHGDKLR